MREWITTNGLGSYASLTYSNLNTSKFHGLLIASLDPPTKRHLFVSNVYETVQIGHQEYDISRVSGVFDFDVFPSFLYNLGSVHLRKTIFMDHEKNTSIVKYEVETDEKISLRHTLALNSRHFYDVTAPGSVSFVQKTCEHGVRISPSNTDKTLQIFLRDSVYQPQDFWVESRYEKDQKRNDSSIDNNMHIGTFEKTLTKSGEYYLIFTLENEQYPNPSKIYFKEFWRKKRLLDQANLPSSCNKLVLSADNFLVKKGDKKSLVAGYHWFADWGRDTLIALPGIALVTKRFDDAKQILSNFSTYCKNGLIPNAFMERDSVAVYNTVDASLWFIDRVYQYLKYTNDVESLSEMWETLCSIVDGYRNGTDFGIHMDTDFLISHGQGLTWMDVKIGDYYPTPRSKKAVEIQALWYNALRIMSTLSTLLGKDDVFYDLAEQVKDSFINQYDHQYDVIDTRDQCCRPNKIFLVSLDFSMIDSKLKESIVQDVQDNLVTVFGLRTLSPDDSRYLGSYLGDHNRDIAYHNGTVWPWLMGPFITAFVKVKNNESVWREFAYNQYVQPMLSVFADRWDGSIYEIFDGDPPYLPRGCISQAWSVAELLRCWVEDIQNITPKYCDFFLHKIRV